MIAITDPNPTSASTSTSALRPWKNPYAAAPVLKRSALPAGGPSGASLFEALRGMDVFSQVQDKDLLRLTAMARTRRAAKGETLLGAGTADGRHLILLLEGEAEVIRESGDGGETLLATLREGEMAGEAALFDPLSPEDTALRASTPVKILVLQRDEVLRGLGECPGLALGILTEMARHLNQVHRRVAGICNQKAPRRIASALVALLDERGTRLKDAEGRRCLLLRRRPTQRAIADLSSTRRETVSRLLSSWQRLGWLEDRHGDLLVFEEARLRALAGEE
jgi:CRP/FNR family transcriptional regulator/CRP/FNR family cyclic AMP-dependent transcriptional regulator